MIGRSAPWAIGTNSARPIGVTTNSAPAAMAARHVSASSTVPTPMTPWPPTCPRASRMAAMALGVVIVISMAMMPPARSASESGSTCSAFCARTTAMMPGSVSSEIISDFERTRCKMPNQVNMTKRQPQSKGLGCSVVTRGNGWLRRHRSAPVLAAPYTHLGRLRPVKLR